jgi:hypothetical protein
MAAHAGAHPILSPDSRVRRILGVLLGLILCIILVSVLLANRSTAAHDRAADAALQYAKQYMTWSQGPKVSSTHVVPLGGLSVALRRYVPAPLRDDVNAGQLSRTYGLKTKVSLIVLSGTFYSLPPDEGVNVNGDVVAIVDVRTNRVLLVTD